MADSFQLALRQSRRQIRDNLPLEYQEKASIQICNQIQNLKQYRQAQRIALYQALGREINLRELWNSALLEKKTCYFPVLNADKTLVFLPATASTPFRTNRYGIGEPDIAKSEAIPAQLLDILFLPLVAFDGYGTRIGMGAGYYDRSLAKVDHPLLMGVAYAFQYYPYIKPQSWDIALHAVVTEQKILWKKALGS